MSVCHIRAPQGDLYLYSVSSSCFSGASPHPKDVLASNPGFHKGGRGSSRPSEEYHILGVLLVRAVTSPVQIQEEKTEARQELHTHTGKMDLPGDIPVG